ncbi:hypothetical protein GGQ62_000651 [Polymorphobacter fuscus]|nr:PEPxxWA-CTERM sorting domain-containing protein [Polymorphobacter fuscus]NJC07653.1 hypothetical protein [Polymorphobacter fuscus]
MASIGPWRNEAACSDDRGRGATIRSIGTARKRSHLPGRGPIEVTPISGADFLFGLGLWNVGGDDQLRLTFYDAQDNVIESVISSPSYGFFGLVNSAGAVRGVVDFVGGNGYAPTDDWQTAVRGNITPGVPEPASWAMLIAGFGLTGAAMRRRRTHAAA